jgi:aminoglycoside phosphotransferase (APT) family kinase protein
MTTEYPNNDGYKQFDISPKGIQSELDKHYSHEIVGEVKNVSKCTDGYANLTLKLETSKGNLILRIYTSNKTAEEIDFEITIIDCLSEKFPVPTIFETKDKSKKFPWNDRFAVLTSFLPGEHVTLNQQEKWMADAAYSTISEVYTHTTDKELEHNNHLRFRVDFEHVTNSLKKCLQEKKAAKYSAIQLEERISKFIPKIDHITASKQDEMEKQLPRGVIHYDMHFNNVLLQKEKKQFTGILDWDICRVGPALSDLAACTIFWCFNGEQCKECLEKKSKMNCIHCTIKFHKEWAEEGIALYEKKRGFKLTELEKKHFYDYVIVLSLNIVNWFFYIEDRMGKTLTEYYMHMFTYFMEQIVENLKLD